MAEPLNSRYLDQRSLPTIIPVFPLAGALLLPRGQLPLNIFEPRYLSMFDAALGSDRLIGMVQPRSEDHTDAAKPALASVGCLGRITQFAESGDGRYVVNLTGVARYRILREPEVSTDFRQCEVDYTDFAIDFEAPDAQLDREVDRLGVLRALRAFAGATELEIDWGGIAAASNELLVNALAMLSPFGVREKQALLEAENLKARADMLIAITEFELTRAGDQRSFLQ